MPTLIIKSTVSCCTSREPPSPDGAAPRPASAPINQSKGAIKDPVPSWTSVEAREFQAIFKEGGSPLREMKRDRLQTTGARFRAIFEADEDLESDEDEIEMEEITSRKSNISFRAVTDKLKKHLSKDSGLSKRHSRSSVGTTEEEVERRAELRRLRQKRIQEELSSEDIYDEDAKSLSSIPATGITSRKRSRDYHGRNSSVTLIKEAIPTIPGIPVQPLSNYRVFADSRLIAAKRATSMPRSNLSLDPVRSIDHIVLSSGAIPRRHSCPSMCCSNLGTAELNIILPSRQRRSMLSPASQLVLRPARLPSIEDLAGSLWRLSFSGEKRGELLRRLSQGGIQPAKPNLPQLETIGRPTKHWLHSQGLRSTSQALTVSENDDNSDIPGSPNRKRTPTQDFGGVDGSGEDTQPIHLHEMGISQRLASRGLQSSSSSPQLSAVEWESHLQETPNLHGASQAIRDERSRYLRSTSDSVPLSERLPQTWGRVIDDGTSSFYPSGSNSIQPSPETSRLSLLSKLGKNKGPFETTISEDYTIEPLPSLSVISTRNISTNSLTIPSTKYPRYPTNDDSSLLNSETDSFRAREAELSQIQTRFISSETRRSPSTPVSSKFREEFDFEPPVQQISQSRKSSAFARLAKLASRSYDGESHMEEVLNVPMPNFDASKLKKEEDGGMWGGGAKSGKRKGKKGKEEEEIKSGLDTLGFGMGKKKKKEDKPNAAEEYQKKFQERVAVKELVMDDWEAEMAATAAKAQAKSRNIVKKSKPSGPDHRYPASWSRFPSHTRKDRTTSAKDSEGIQRHDFAILGKDDNGEDIWCLAHDDDGHQTFLDYLHKKKKIRERVAAKIEDGLYHLDTEHGSASEVKGRRSSLNPAGDLDFPELEVLPITSMAKGEEEIEGSTPQRMKELEKRRKLLAQAVGADGSLDENRAGNLEVGTSHENRNVNPNFYGDCVVGLAGGEVDNGDESEDLMLMSPKTSKMLDKFRTWSGREYSNKLAKRTRHSVGTSAGLRDSTYENWEETERMEEVERRRVLSMVEQAWPKRK